MSSGLSRKARLSRGNPQKGKRIMPSELDRQLMAIMDRLVAPGGQFETIAVTRAGQSYPAFVNAPPSLPALYAFAAQTYGAAPFLVDGDLRLTCAKTLALARRLASGLLASHGVERGMRVGIAARNSANSKPRANSPSARGPKVCK